MTTARTRGGARADAPRSGVCVVGLGNWGTSLVEGLLKAGVDVREIVMRDRTAAAGSRGRANRAACTKWATAALDAEIVWLCLPDRLLRGVAEKLAKRRGEMHGQTVVHSSGALTLEVLEAVRQAGAEVASVHPVMSFPTRRVEPLEGVLFGIEADRPSTRRKMIAFAKALGGRPFAIDSKSKVLYHAAGTLASPLLLSAMAAAIETARLAGLSARQAEHMVSALAEATVRNASTRGVERSFSGPFARGDAATVDLHLRALAEHPMLTGVYRALALEALERLPVRGREGLRRTLAEKK